jgi:hypothetical protein
MDREASPLRRPQSQGQGHNQDQVALRAVLQDLTSRRPGRNSGAGTPSDHQQISMDGGECCEYLQLP